MKRVSIGFVVGVVAALLHFALVLACCNAAWHSRSSTAGLAFLPFFILDAPLLVLQPLFRYEVFGRFTPLILFGVLGSALWFVIPWQIGKIASWLFSRWPKTASVLALIVAIPIVGVAFGKLSSFTMERQIQGERPAELKPRLGLASSTFLTSKVVFSEGNVFTGISAICRGDFRSSAGTELFVALPRAVVFLDDHYRINQRIGFGARVFKSIEPVDAGDHSCHFLAYRFQEGVHLFDERGEEKWKSTSSGVRFGDIDGDGKLEFAAISGSGVICLLDADGHERWSRPVVGCVGRLEMADVRDNGKAEIIYSNAANASGNTQFVVLDAAGAAVSQFTIATKSYEFIPIHWPRRETTPFLLLTEKNKIRIVDMAGNAIVELDAPGCRTFGAVAAVTVQFKKGDSKYLAVKKNLHPDLTVLYVYNNDGKLVYQRNDVRVGVEPPVLAAVPAQDGAEKLLVAAAEKSRLQVLEYSVADGAAASNP